MPKSDEEIPKKLTIGTSIGKRRWKETVRNRAEWRRLLIQAKTTRDCQATDHDESIDANPFWHMTSLNLNNLEFWKSVFFLISKVFTVN